MRFRIYDAQGRTLAVGVTQPDEGGQHCSVRDLVRTARGQRLFFEEIAADVKPAGKPQSDPDPDGKPDGKPGEKAGKGGK